jgi:hypothetical protein
LVTVFFTLKIFLFMLELAEDLWNERRKADLIRFNQNLAEWTSETKKHDSLPKQQPLPHIIPGAKVKSAPTSKSGKRRARKEKLNHPPPPPPTPPAPKQEAKTKSKFPFGLTPVFEGLDPSEPVYKNQLVGVKVFLDFDSMRKHTIRGYVFSVQQVYTSPLTGASFVPTNNIGIHVYGDDKENTLAFYAERKEIVSYQEADTHVMFCNTCGEYTAKVAAKWREHNRQQLSRIK